MNNQLQGVRWSENVILVDADYVDKVAFNLIVNFERMLGRRIPQANLAHWIDCISLDGGIREGEHETLVVMIHSEGKKELENFMPANFKKDVDGKAFKDYLGEFIISTFAKEDIPGGEFFFTDALQLIVAQKDVRRVMVIPDVEDALIYNKVREVLKEVDEEKAITVFSMLPTTGGQFKQEILGYSLMAALGIHSDEINGKM